MVILRVEGSPKGIPNGYVRDVRKWLRLCKNVRSDRIPPWVRRGFVMKRFIEGEDRTQSTLFPERLDDWIGEDNPVRVVDVFVDELDLGGGLCQSKTA